MSYRTSSRPGALSAPVVFRSSKPWGVLLLLALLVLGSAVYAGHSYRTVTLSCTRDADADGLVFSSTCTVTQTVAGVPVWPSRTFGATNLDLARVSDARGSDEWVVRVDEHEVDDLAVRVDGGDEAALKIGRALLDFQLDDKVRSVRVVVVKPPHFSDVSRDTFTVFILVFTFAIALLAAALAWPSGSVEFRPAEGYVRVSTKRAFKRRVTRELPWNEQLGFGSREEARDKATWIWVTLTTAGRTHDLWRTRTRAGAERVADAMNGTLMRLERAEGGSL